MTNSPNLATAAARHSGPAGLNAAFRYGPSLALALPFAAIACTSAAPTPSSNGTSTADAAGPADTGGDAKTTAPGPACTSDATCVQAVASNQWRGKASDNPLSVCAEPYCHNGKCATRPRPTDTECDDGDGLACTIGLCSAAGSCTAAAKYAAGACAIDGKCVKAGASRGSAKLPDMACFTCDPSASPNSWSQVKAGTPCPDDGNPCTADFCDGGDGKCTHPPAAPSKAYP